jgi:hypothetical protein
MTNYTPRGANFIDLPNTPPTLAVIGDRAIDEGSELKFTVVATDTNQPPQTLTWSLNPGAPAGATINSANGLFKWTPTEIQGPGAYPLTFVVRDNGSPSMSATQTISVTVNEVNNAPTLTPLLSQNIMEGGTLSVTNSATDADAPPQTITFSLDPGGPAGVAINPSNGLITWTPTEAQGPGTYSIIVRATDNGSPPQSDTTSLSVSVSEVNSPPQISFPSSWRIHAGSMLSFNATATDADLPAQSITFTIDSGAPTATHIDPATGAFTWEPAESDVGTNTLTLRATDDGPPALSATGVLTVIVDAALAIVITHDGDMVSIAFNTVSGRSYRVDYKEDLSDEWAQLKNPEVADSTTLTVEDNMAGKSQRFYRVIESP